MFKRKSLETFKTVFFIGFSAFLIGTGASILAPKSSASPGFFEYQWFPEAGYKKLRYYQSTSNKLDRATYYFFLKGNERIENIRTLTLRIPEYFDAKIKSKKLSLCKVKVGGFTNKTRCLETIPSKIQINENQTSIAIVPESPIPQNKDTYAVVMKIFNPRKGGMFQFQAISKSQQPGEMPISTYLGTWNITVR
tara:strand:+ start:353 stop:934 length:582 start_codon:yes stop_codon:yes gene_type:complete